MTPRLHPFRRLAVTLCAAACALAAAALAPGHTAVHASEDEDPPAVLLGERLFLETRFSQHFFARSRGDVNAAVAPDPSVAALVTAGGDELRGPFRREAINCRQCHLVDEARRPLRTRTYADFARRSPVPARDDGVEVTLRNSPQLVGMSRARVVVEPAGRRRTRRTATEPLLHFDAEFATAEDLVVGTLTGRNFGWLPAERDQAVRHVARVIRGDDGRGELAREFGGRYRDAFAGRDRVVGHGLDIPYAKRVDVDALGDEELVRAAAHFVAVYLRSLDFARDHRGAHSGSPYDAFLRKNRLPREPRPAETDAQYTARLRAAVGRLQRPQWVDFRDGTLALHGGRAFRFGPEELHGLRTFLATGGDGGVGNCATCHPGPDFTDFRFHNTGVSQFEYDRAHGEGAFAALAVPGLAERNALAEAWLPATAAHPDREGPFARIPDPARPGHADLGLWNVFGDPDRPGPQTALRALLGGDADDGALLARSVAAFKTPSLRSLGQSDPYLHDGSADTLTQAVRHYVRAADLARGDALRNAAPELSAVRLAPDDVHALTLFLRSLDEDYR